MSGPDAFGKWRGTATDAGVTFPASNTWQQIHDSMWHIDTYEGFGGVLAYGLPMLPSEDSGSAPLPGESTTGSTARWLETCRIAVAVDPSSGEVGRPTGTGSPGTRGPHRPVTTSPPTATSWGAPRTEAPELVIDFDVACGTPLRGQSDRMDTLTKLYPGDDVVDLIGCDTYDWYHTTSKDPAGWQLTQHPKDAVGIADVADFARAHGKGLTVPEWGLASEDEGGAADNPYFIERMREFFEANADILVMENYFNEPATSLANSIGIPF